MLPYTTTIPCNGLNLRNNFNGIINDLRSNQMLMGVNQNPVATLLQPNPVQLSVNMNNNANKDSQWLTLEVCREFQRSMCPRNELECKYAHPPPYIETQNGRVMCCYDSIKGKCHRIKPPCKYLHPPQHLKDLLIQNGKNNLLMKNLQMNIIQQQISNLSGNPQSRLGFLSMNNANSTVICPPQLHSPSVVPVTTQKPGNENQKLSFTPEQTDSTSSSDQTNHNKSLYDNCSISSDVALPQTNPNRFSNFYECQLTQYLPNNNSPGASLSISTTMPNEVNSVDSKISRKRPLTMINSTSNKIEQSLDKPIPFKKINLLDSQLSVINRDHHSNQLGFMINPLMSYQNQLASYLSLSNQTGLQSNSLNSLNLQTLLASNNGNLMSMGPSVICPNTLINVNGFPMISPVPTQQQLAATTLLQAANAFQYNRGLTDFGGFQ